jgi:23S rRNA pseudouridine2605 synthase
MEKRLQTILAHAGAASRRSAASLIEKGKVKVDGRVVREKGLKLDPSLHEISLNGVSLKSEEEKMYFLLNKPGGVISTAKDTHGRKKITDMFRGVKERLYPVGRLDKDTTGLIILTNDGDLAHGLSHPSFEIEKEYIARTEYPLEEKALKMIASGVEIDGKKTSPCGIERLGKLVYRISLHEGRKRQIRRMFDLAGSRVVELERTGYAGLSIGRIKRGEYRRLTRSEVKSLKKKIERGRAD